LQRLFNRLDRRGKGLLSALVMRLSTSRDLLSAASLDLVGSRLSPSVHAVREKSALLFDLLETFLGESGETVVRLTDAFADHPVWPAGLRLALSDTLGEIESLAEGLQLVRERLESGNRTDDSVMPLLNEMRAVTRRLQLAGDGLKRALDPGRGDATVRWIEARGRDRAISVSTVPLDLAPILREDLFARSTTTILTSATLATDGRFDFLTQRLGLDTPDLAPRSAIYPSPFAYRERTILAVPSDVPAPNVDAGRHFNAVGRIAIDVAEAANGGMFVLFTSH
jgi:Rad3-related DNA helicase